MPVLTLILPELAAPSATTDTALLPQLPVLELWLARAHRHPLPDHWHRWLATTAGGPLLATAAAGGVVAASLGLTETRHYWLATPVHYVAGIDTLRLHPAGLLRLSDAQQGQLAEDFMRVFAGSGWELMITGGRDLLLVGPAQAAFETVDPATLLGRDPAAGWSRAAVATPLRRLAAEVEMWLHEHVVNRQREASGQLPATGLWFWSGGSPSPAVPASAPGVLWADDAYASALWRLLGAGTQAVPVPVGLERAPGAEDLTVVLSLDQLQPLESHWLSPALRQLRTGQRGALSLVAAGCCWTLTRMGLRRFWRRPQPWWVGLRAC